MEGSQNGPGGVGGSNGKTRAQIFEDEKQRIIETCFGKKDETDSLLESYITHIKIIEDAAYPSSPAPPNSNPNAKKPRLIIVAVRKSGRVRMHKARENVNGSFSIGKTWLLDDLTAVQSYSGAVPSTQEEAQQKEWAGGVGFTVTIGKPYYWQAHTQKEKQFFIASLVKIYTKYTGGKAPELIGFDGRERDQLLGVSAAASRPAPPSLQSGSPGQPPYAQSQNRPPRRDPSREPPLRKQPSRDGVPRPQPQVPMNGNSMPNYPQTSRPPMRNQRGDSPSSSIDSNGTGPQQNQQSLRRLAGSNPSQDSFSRSDDGSQPPRSRGGMTGLPNAAGRFQDRSITPTSQRAATPESSFPSAKDSSDVPPVPVPQASTIPQLSERRRPPIPNLGDSRQRSQNNSDNLVPAPLSSPGMRRDDLRPPTRSSERSLPREKEQATDRMSEDMPIDTPPSSNGFVKANKPQRSEDVEQSAPTQDIASSTAKTLSPLIPSTSPAVQMPDEPEEDLRPGLGSMIRKKSRGDIAGQFLKAAQAASAFKPRAGGAAERLLGAQAKTSAGPDGITGVVPAPSLLRSMSGDDTNPSKPVSNATDKPPQQAPSSQKPAEIATEVKVTVSPSSRPGSLDGPPPVPSVKVSPESTQTTIVKRAKLPPRITMAKEIESLGIDPNVLGDRGGELVEAWDQFGYSGTGIHNFNVDKMLEEANRELNKIRTGGWLKLLEDEDERIAAIQNGLDKCIAECDELDGLLTLYGVELGTLNEDIAYIEAQSQGLQVQAANQKLLHAELQSLLETISISSDELGPLREASLESTRGIQSVEDSLVRLFKAMLTIDPSLGVSSSRPSEEGSLSSARPGGYGNSEIGSMRVLQEKKDVYKGEISLFLRRLKPFLQIKFGAAIDETSKAMEQEKKGNLSRAAGKAKLDPRNFDLARNLLWKYSPLMLFTREVDRLEWEELLKMYEMASRPMYQNQFREVVFAWKRIVRKPIGDESDILFTSQVEKQTESITTTARKLTVKRSQTLAKSLRSPIGDSSSKASQDKADGRLQPYDVFSGLLDETIPIIVMEQNFLVEFFHISSLEHNDFPEAVAAASPESRRGTDLKRPRVMDPNRDLAKLVVSSMEEIYSSYASDMQGLMEWTLQADPLQGVGVIAAIERRLIGLEETSQEYLARTLQKLHAKLVGLFNKFLDEQIRAIEETKVKIKKRKGVIGFIRIFPSFSLALETMLSSSGDLEVRGTVNQAYTRINKTMFESLKVIARENPGANVGGADPEDKEALNYQILLIENMNHYLEEVDTRSNPVLEDWKQNAGQEMEEHMSLYLNAVVRRPLGKLLDFLESTESLLTSRQPGEAATKISGMASHSKTTFKKVLAGYDSKEIRRGIEALKKRVEKHFGDADDPGLSRGLVAKVTQNCEKYYEKVEDRILTVSRDVYDGDVTADWSRGDIVAGFHK